MTSDDYVEQIKEYIKWKMVANYEAIYLEWVKTFGDRVAMSDEDIRNINLMHQATLEKDFEQPSGMDFNDLVDRILEMSQTYAINEKPEMPSQLKMRKKSRRRRQNDGNTTAQQAATGNGMPGGLPIQQNFMSFATNLASQCTKFLPDQF
jgi:hypothetical protein